MLVLARKVNESIVIDGQIVVKIVRLDGDVAKVGISAPSSVPVHRMEVYEEIQRSNQQALINPQVAVPKLWSKSATPFATTSVALVRRKPAALTTVTAKPQPVRRNP
jgi:carbon storage regulator